MLSLSFADAAGNAHQKAPPPSKKNFCMLIDWCLVLDRRWEMVWTRRWQLSGSDCLQGEKSRQSRLQFRSSLTTGRGSRRNGRFCDDVGDAANKETECFGRYVRLSKLAGFSGRLSRLDDSTGRHGIGVAYSHRSVVRGRAGYERNDDIWCNAWFPE